MAWSLELVPKGEGPLFLRIARAVTDDVRRGRLVAGQRLPGTRSLADALGVHRNTVLAAFAELEAQGWIATEPARGSFVAPSLPEVRATQATKHITAPGYALGAAPEFGAVGSGVARRGELLLSAGVPDPREFPVDALARAWRRVVKRERHRLLTYDAPQGHPALRAALAELLRATRGLACGANELLVTRGSQMALDLVARGLLAPGDRVAVEALGYRPAWDALRLAGAELEPVLVDAGGLDVDALAARAAHAPFRAVYLTSHHQYPTTVTLGAARRLALLDLARRHRWVVIEDDYDHEFHYEGRPVPPLAAADGGAHVVYVGTLSKILAPGLRLGFLAAPPRVVERLAALRSVMDRQGDRTMEAAVAELIEDGELERHVRRVRELYFVRRDAMARALRSRLGAALSFELPRGGIALWAQIAPDVDVEAWLAAAAAQGVHVASGRRYSFGGEDPGALRFSYAALRPSEIERATQVLAATLVRTRRAGRAKAVGGASRRGAARRA